MSIKTDVVALQEIRKEIKLLNDKKRTLKEREKNLEQKIAEYLKAKEQPGVKHQGTAIILEEKEKCGNKKAKERDIDAINVLEKHGVNDPSKVLKELLQARKGDPVLKESLKIKKYHNQ
jgi:hypothetical protein